MEKKRMARGIETEPTALTFPDVQGQEDASSSAPRPKMSWQRLMTAISLIVGIVGVVWIFGHRATRVSDARSNSKSAFTLVGKMTQKVAQIGDHLVPSKGFVPSGELERPVDPAVADETLRLANANILKAPIFVANLTYRVGRYLVSVRRVNGSTQSFEANPTAAGIGAASSQLVISLQVMAVDGGDVGEVVSMGDDFVAIDDTGKRLAPIEQRDFRFPKGYGALFRLPGPDPRATCFRVIQGHLRLKNGQNEPKAKGGAATGHLPHIVPGRTELTYVLRNAPIPWYPHIFGVAGAMVMGAERVSACKSVETNLAGGQDVSLVRGDTAAGLFAGMPPEVFQAPGPKLSMRLNMADRVPSALTLPLLTLPLLTLSLHKQSSAKSVAAIPPGHLDLTVTPHLGQDGEITVDIAQSGAGAPLVKGISLWDNEPAAFAIPAKRIRGMANVSGDLYLYLHLFLDQKYPDRLYNGSLPTAFMPKPGQRGGEVIGSIGTRDVGLGMASAHIEAVRLNPQGQPEGATERLRVALDRSGQFVLPNLAAGRYRLRLIDAVPTLSVVVARRKFDDYISHRFHLVHPILANPVVEVTAIAGVPITMERWRYESGGE